MLNINSITPDSPFTKVFMESISQHSSIARYYKYRTPYMDRLFSELTSRLGLDSGSRLLDVCCGSGELAAGFSGVVGKVYAIDGSEEMLSFAPCKDNIVYAQHDVNAAVYQAPEKIDHFVIGRAIHWIKTQSLIDMIRANLNPEGSVVVTNSTLWLRDAPWQHALNDVLGKYGKKDVKVDLDGIETLKAAGFKTSGKISFGTGGQFDLKYLFLHTLSLAYGEFFERINADIVRFRDDLIREMSPFLKNGKLEAPMLNWALIYRRV